MKWKFKMPKNPRFTKAMVQIVVAVSEAVVHELAKSGKKLK
jgi:hypothetical protein